MTRRRGRKYKQLLDDLNENIEYCKLKEEALNRTLYRGHGPLERQTTQ